MEGQERELATGLVASAVANSLRISGMVLPAPVDRAVADERCGPAHLRFLVELLNYWSGQLRQHPSLGAALPQSQQQQPRRRRQPGSRPGQTQVSAVATGSDSLAAVPGLAFGGGNAGVYQEAAGLHRASPAAVQVAGASAAVAATGTVARGQIAGVRGSSTISPSRGPSATVFNLLPAGAWRSGSPAMAAAQQMVQQQQQHSAQQQGAAQQAAIAAATIRTLDGRASTTAAARAVYRTAAMSRIAAPSRVPLPAQPAIISGWIQAQQPLPVQSQAHVSTAAAIPRGHSPIRPIAPPHHQATVQQLQYLQAIAQAQQQQQRLQETLQQRKQKQKPQQRLQEALQQQQQLPTHQQSQQQVDFSHRRLTKQQQQKHVAAAGLGTSPTGMRAVTPQAPVLARRNGGAAALSRGGAAGGASLSRVRVEASEAALGAGEGDGTLGDLWNSV